LFFYYYIGYYNLLCIDTEILIEGVKVQSHAYRFMMQFFLACLILTCLVNGPAEIYTLVAHREMGHLYFLVWIVYMRKHCDSENIGC
jgi:hypothetical protein